MSTPFDFDLVALVADADQRETLTSLLGKRRKSLGIRDLRYKLLKHPQRDSGCVHGAVAVLETQVGLAMHALVVLDHEGSGQETVAAQELARRLKGRLEDAGWEDRAEVVVIQPELEAWVWSDSPHLEEVLGWPEDEPHLRSWLAAKGLWLEGSPRPTHPEEALHRVLKHTRVRHSAALYGQLAEKVSLVHCSDASFVHLKSVLRRWFPAERR
jgi:hypothetical protein